MFINSIFVRIKNRVLREKRLKQDIVAPSDWLEHVERDIASYQAMGKIPSPWGFLTIPQPTDTIDQIQQIYNQGHYQCNFSQPPKRILDCGGNVGLSAIYFAKTWPTATIECYEADPKLASVLVNNCKVANCLERVNIHPLAVTDKTGTTHFQSTGTDSGYVSSTGQEIPCIDIAEIV